ncbi:hypothetical protein A3I80_02145 [Candidatus Gottesmanbacteria bacterium RIFCSPLOWO2_02_FULL_40_10]|nr:MAG: hypothetical protein A3I80_02145 [Candidatus Gottesmanbacteria bacterium RIFCSPLOWO2_02_FULL_40_10]
MKRRFIRLSVLSLVITLFYALNGQQFFHRSTVRAVGDLSVDWGVEEGKPVFEINNFAPGDADSRYVRIKNNASNIRPVGFRGILRKDSGSLSERLLLTVSSEGVDYYGGSGDKTLVQFFTDGTGPDGIPLFNLASGEEKTVVFKVVFDPDAGNDYQNTSVVFDLNIGIAITVPEECLSVNFKSDPIFGTQNNDRIRGTNGNDLIFAFEGDDRVDSGNGNDCVVGGPGNDKLYNSNGNDLIYGNEGNDILSGSNGSDIIYAGPGNDRITASNGNDKVYGQEGNDFIHGGNGEDELTGGSGSDEILGSNGNDLITGDGHNDILEGGNGRDYLDGGDGTDTISGNLGLDTCFSEIKSGCEL